MADIVIRGGTIHDGSGREGFTADIAITGPLIRAIGQNLPPGTRELDARGLIVTPGFVDIHNHYDGQATWDEELAPSTPHGVTTLVMGNYGVAFAPARPDHHNLLIALMEGVEDIPGTALHEGLRWNWETFPEYLNALAERQYTVDIGAMIAHGPLRVGLRADINVIDYDRLSLRAPHTVADLPAGGTRFLQEAEGYRYTLVAGEIARKDDAFTGARPGHPVRSNQFPATGLIAAE
jgi:N-acyl-D-aspartate/D-glutamate deacylase